MTQPPEKETTGDPADVDRRTRASISFWSLVVGVPAIFSVLRLGVEAGGELQTTLLLVANVGPVNLVAAFITTAAALLSTGLVAVFALGTVLSVSFDRAQAHSSAPRQPPLFARWSEATPIWFIVASFAVAFATWQILYLPLLLPALAAAFQISPVRLHPRRVVGVALVLALLAGYGWFVTPTLWEAWKQREMVVLLLLAAPPVLALFVTGPVPAAVARVLAPVAQIAMLGMVIWAAVPVILIPVLPLTVITVKNDSGANENIRGHVITVDDIHTVVLQEHGGVRYIPVDQVDSQVLCPSEEELPRYRLRIHDFHVEDSVLGALGRRVRPSAPVDAACRAAVTS